MPSPQNDDQRLLQRCRALSQRVLVSHKRFAGEWDAIREELDSISASLKTLKSQAESASGSEAESKLAAARECEQTLRNGPGGDLHKFRKKRSKPLILRLMMGPHCPVDVVRSEEAYKLKDEYHSFRARTAQLLILYSGALLGLLQRSHLLGTQGSDGSSEPLRRKSFTPIVMVLLVWLVYVYLAMASRESLLLMNGSHIRPWWIWHHYLSALTCFVMLSLPVDSPTLQRFVRGWLAWTLLQATLMIFQNMYQRKRMYTRIALGKSSAMDVVGGESSGMRGQLLALLPGLFALQGWQIVLGGSMMLRTAQAVVDARGWLELEAHEDELWARRGLFVIGLLMTGMGVMNASQTVSTMVAKQRRGPRRTAQVPAAADAGAEASEKSGSEPAQEAGVQTRSGRGGKKAS